MSTSEARLRNAKTAINGPEGYDRKLDDVLYKPQKLKKGLENLKSNSLSTYAEVMGVIELLKPEQRCVQGWSSNDFLMLNISGRCYAKLVITFLMTWDRQITKGC